MLRLAQSSFQVLELYRVSLAWRKVCFVTSPFSRLEKVRLIVRVKTFMHVAMVCCSWQSWMHRHSHGGCGCNHSNRPPSGALLCWQGRAAMAWPFSPVWLRPSAALQPGAALKSSPCKVGSFAGGVWLSLQSLLVVLLLPLASVPAWKLGAKRLGIVQGFTYWLDFSTSGGFFERLYHLWQTRVSC